MARVEVIFLQESEEKEFECNENCVSKVKFCIQTL